MVAMVSLWLVVLVELGDVETLKGVKEVTLEIITVETFTAGEVKELEAVVKLVEGSIVDVGTSFSFMIFCCISLN